MLNKVREASSALFRILRIRFDKSPIARAPQLVDFVSTRSAYVAQTALFGYLKTRMGRQYVEIFKDDSFLPAIETAKWKIYAACLSDLTIYSVALSAHAAKVDRQTASSLAKLIHASCVEETFEGKAASEIREQTEADFERRCEATIWPNAAIGEAAFSVSPPALADSSPVSDEFRELDREIVMNSIRLRWADVRDQLRKRLDGEAICSALRSGDQPVKALNVPSVASGTKQEN